MRTIDGKLVPETVAEAFAPSVSALVVVDIQNDYCSDRGHFDRRGRDLSMVRRMLPTLETLLAEARALGIPCIYTQQTTLPDGQSDSPAWLFFKTRDGGDPHSTLAGSWGEAFVSGFEPTPGDAVVRKHRSSGFVNTNLDLILRARGVRALAVCGVTTEGCVESTLRDAAFHDYFVCLVEDCAASDVPELHELSVQVTRARHPVLRADALLAIWRGAAAGTRGSAPAASRT
jgi:nicotinamidase-related amidase